MLLHRFIDWFKEKRHAFIIAACLAALASPAHAAVEADKSTAVIFVYQRIGEDSVPQSSIPADQFKLHLAELKAGGYTVLPLGKVIDALKSGGNLPPKTVAITFDGAWLPTLTTAIPLLEEAKFPFTVFFSADQADAAAPGHMGWAQLKSLKKNKLASLGILPAAYTHMTEQGLDETAALVNKAVSRYREILKEDPAFFAWPYGEYSAALKKRIEAYNFRAAFGQHSGVAHAGSDFLALPRFIMTGDVGDLDRFRLTAGALPLPVADVVPEDPAAATQNPPPIGFTVAPGLGDLSRLSCFVSGTGKVPLSRLDNRVEIRLDEPLEERRARVNCTMPAGGDDSGWRWFGMLLILPGVDAGEAGGPPPGEVPEAE